MFTEALAVDREGVEALLSATLEEELAEPAGETPVVEGLGPRLDHGWRGGSLPRADETIQDGITDRLAVATTINRPCRRPAERERLLREFYVMEQTSACR